MVFGCRTVEGDATQHLNKNVIAKSPAQLAMKQSRCFNGGAPKPPIYTSLRPSGAQR